MESSDPHATLAALVGCDVDSEGGAACDPAHRWTRPGIGRRTARHSRPAQAGLPKIMSTRRPETVLRTAVSPIRCRRGEGAEHLLEPGRRDDLEQGGRLVTGVPEGVVRAVASSEGLVRGRLANGLQGS